MTRRRWSFLSLGYLVAFSIVFAASLAGELGRGQTMVTAVSYALAPIVSFSGVSIAKLWLAARRRARPGA